MTKRQGRLPSQHVAKTFHTASCPTMPHNVLSCTACIVQFLSLSPLENVNHQHILDHKP